MKKFKPFLAAVLFFIAAQVSGITVHISGTVTSDSSGAPIPNHEVHIFADSSDPGGFFYTHTAHTNESGFYEVNVENVPDTGTATIFYVRTFDCMNVLHQDTVLSTNTPITVNFVICPPNPQDCQAHFTATPDSINYLTWHFLDISTHSGTITSRTWSFGDGSGATGSMDPHHTYEHTGVYHVCLTITTSTGCTSDHCQEIQVGSNGSGCQAYFTYYKVDSLNTEPTYHFLNQSSGNPTSQFWNFGDPASGTNNTSTTHDPTHIFSASGVYNVCLTIFGDSCQDTWCASIEVEGNQVTCISHFSWERTFLTVAFHGHSEDQYPMTYTWYMGDSAQTVLTGQNVTFTYLHNGSYTVSLVTADSTGCTYSSSQTIWVSSTCDVWGMVILNNTYADHGTVQLLKLDNGVITVIDTKEIQDSGMFQFGIVGPGDYYLKAELSPNSMYYGQFVPTYFEHSATFAQAHMINLGGVQNPYNIHMVHVEILTPGQGTINGTITQGNKMNGSGSPVPNVEVMIMNPNNQPQGFTFTDESGHFSFADIAFGSYIIYPDQAGMLTTPAHVTLDDMHTVLNLPFDVTGSNIVFGINDKMPAGISRISEAYPNPAKEYTNLTIVTFKDITVTIAIFNAVGQSISITSFNLLKGEQHIQLNLQNLNSGNCFLRITSSEGGSVVKKVNIY